MPNPQVAKCVQVDLRQCDIGFVTGTSYVKLVHKTLAHNTIVFFTIVSLFDGRKHQSLPLTAKLYRYPLKDSC